MTELPLIEVKLAVYRHFAETGAAPRPSEVSLRSSVERSDVLHSYLGLQDQRVLYLHPDDETIRMAPPFSGIPTQHRVVSEGIEYFANCAWDALGIPAALQRPCEVFSRCEQSGEPMHLPVTVDGPPDEEWWFHCPVPAAKWWDDIVFT